ncbi:MAG: phage structural protein [Myxococcota bacterium]
MIDTMDPAQLFCTFNGFLLGGFADGTFISVERNEDTWIPYVGADGEYARARNRNRSGRIKFTLMQTSSSNDYLSAQAAADELTGSNTGVVQIKDGLGRTLINGADAYVLKPAVVEFGKELTTREWTIEVPQLDVTIGGNGPT